MKNLYNNLNGKYRNFIAPFLWLHGETIEDVIKEIHAIHNTGIRGVCLESRTHENFCEEAWWRDLAIIFEECEKLGMKVWILDDKHFPSGYANGIFDEKYKHLKKWDIIERHIDVAGPVTDGAAMLETWRWDPVNDEIIAVFACKKAPDGKLTSDIIDISDNIRDGMVYFDLPDGYFRIVFLVKTRFYMGKYYESFSDKLNPEATEAYLKEVYEPHYEHFKKYFGNTFAGFFSDEPGFENNRSYGLTTDLGKIWQEYPWHERVYNRLFEKYGEDTYKKLMLLWFEDSENEYIGVRYDYMSIITDEYSMNFTQKIGTWCREHGVEYIGHIIEDENTHAKTGSGAGHYFKSMCGQDMSGVDVVLHQIIPGMRDYSNACSTSYMETSNRFYNYVLAKLAASDAVQDERKHGRAMCELFGAYGWAEGTKIMKFLADHMIMRGINHFVPHAFSPKEDDEDCPPTFYNHGKNPLYSYMNIIMGYMNRMSDLLSGFKRITDCAILYDAEAIWCGGEFVKNEDIAKELWNNLIDYDFISEDNLSTSRIVNKKICLGLAEYSHIIIPFRKFITPALKNIIDRLVKKDIDVIFVGGRPDYDVYGNKTEITGGRDCAVEDIAAMLEDFCEYDVNNKGFLSAAHYSNGKNDIYLFANEGLKTVSCSVTVRNTSLKQYFLYDAVENKIYKKCRENIELELYPYNCVAVILGDVNDVEISCNKKYISKHIIHPQYEIDLCGDVRENNYERYAVASDLKSITGMDGIHDFAGKIRYKFTVSPEKDGLYELDLGQVGECAEVYMNGSLCGRRIMPPYKFDMGALSADKECLITAVISTHSGYKYKDNFSRYLLFEPMGMTGPVTLLEYEKEI